MPGGGLYSLVAYGAQNVLLSGNPDFTYFYKTYKKYSHFAEESVTTAMTGPQELSFDQPVQVRLKLQRVADLVRDMYFTFNLPDIYCKALDLTDPNIFAFREAQYNFNWVRFIGCHIIQNVAFFIGGQKIQEFDGAYMIAKAQADYDVDTFTKWQRLVGDVPELTNPSTGIYAGGSASVGYPLVFNDYTLPAANRPSIFGREIQVPLPFWFTESTYESLPLLSLQYMECEVQITLRPIRDLYQILDSSGNTVKPGFKMVPPLASQPTNPSYIEVSDITDVTIDNFLVDWGEPLPLIKSWSLNPRIQSTYVYLTDDERKQFASTPLQYLVRQVTTYQYPGIVSRQFVDLYTHNPINRLIIIPRRTDSLTYKNDTTNYTNWPFASTPYIAPATPYPPWVVTTEATGQLITVAGQQPILQTLRILCDGNEIQEEKPIQYFSYVVPWKYLKGAPDPNLIIYPFGLTSPNTQPDGSINSSRIKNFQVDLNPYPLLPTTNYAYDITIYTENINWVTIAGGMGGLKYAL
jgi:hypothetical protein